MKALFAWGRTDGHGCRTGAVAPDAVDFIQLHHRPDRAGPEVTVTLRAALRDGKPTIEYELPAVQSADGAPHVRPDIVEGGMTICGSGLPAREPEATCEGCGATGTVGRANRHFKQGETETHRFCVHCWPEWSARLRARWEEQDRLRHEDFMRATERHQEALSVSQSGTGMSFEAATWHNTLSMVRSLLGWVHNQSPPPAPADLRTMADEIASGASQVEGTMPWEVELFVAQYGSPGNQVQPNDQVQRPTH